MEVKEGSLNLVLKQVGSASKYDTNLPFNYGSVILPYTDTHTHKIEISKSFILISETFYLLFLFYLFFRVAPIRFRTIQLSQFELSKLLWKWKIYDVLSTILKRKYSDQSSCGASKLVLTVYVKWLAECYESSPVFSKEAYFFRKGGFILILPSPFSFLPLSIFFVSLYMMYILLKYTFMYI